jgi:DNA modification methylase
MDINRAIASDLHIETVGNAILINADCEKVERIADICDFRLAFFSSPYPGMMGFDLSVRDYLDYFLPKKLGAIIPAMKDNGVIVQNVWFPRDNGWYDERIFDIPRIYRTLGMRMIDPHPWDKINMAPAGNHKRYAHNEFEFCFAFAKSGDYVYNPYRRPYADKTVAKAVSGNMRQADQSGHYAGGHSELDPRGAIQSNVFRISPTGGKEQYRPRIADRVFPIALAERVVLQYSNSGDLVLDPFCGSGTTPVAAVTNGRYAIGFDTNYENIRVASAWLKEVQRHD